MQWNESPGFTTCGGMFRFERGLGPRNRLLGEVSEGVVETPSDQRTS